MIVRAAARVIVVDDEGRTLLFRGGDPARSHVGTRWFTPGGGIEEAESSWDAARRELREETGLKVEVSQLRGPIYTQDFEFSFDGELLQQHETFFSVRVAHFIVDDSGWTPQEKALIVESHWWTMAEIEKTDETIYPTSLPTLLKQIVHARTDAI